MQLVLIAEILSRVTDHLTKAMSEGRSIYVVYANYNSNKKDQADWIGSL
jgi:hypothetical protein